MSSGVDLASLDRRENDATGLAPMEAIAETAAVRDGHFEARKMGRGFLRTDVDRREVLESSGIDE
jgi:hypothetical protein